RSTGRCARKVVKAGVACPSTARDAPVRPFVHVPANPRPQKSPEPRHRVNDVATQDERAGDGNRTRVASLEDWGSTIELRPRGDSSARVVSVRREGTG